MRRIRSRLEPRLDGLPDDATLRAHLEQLSTETLHTLVVSEPWDSATVGGDEVDVDWLLPAPEAAAAGPVLAAALAGDVTVVTADRGLRARLSAPAVGPGTLLDRLP